jgi:hypothetical protein
MLKSASFGHTADTESLDMALSISMGNNELFTELCAKQCMEHPRLLTIKQLTNAIIDPALILNIFHGKLHLETSWIELITALTIAESAARTQS